MVEAPRIAAIIVAAGRSSRLPGDVPKIYRPLQGKMVFEHSLEVFQAHPRIADVLVVANPDHAKLYNLVKERGVWFVKGGASRQESVYCGLDALADTPPDWVLVHDAARPNVTPELIDRLLHALQQSPAAIPAIAVKDTIKRADNNHVAETLPRDELKAVQTPQAFHYPELLAAHMAAAHQEYTDDAAVAEAVGMPVALVEGCENNHKLTTPQDWQRLAPEDSHAPMQTRIGQGYDVHQLVEDAARPLMLCGVCVESPLALKGHSDADVALHALVDAMLGAIGEGDIGDHFPPTDAQWKDCDSAAFVSHAHALIQQKGGTIVNADITIIAQTPKLMDYKKAMREKVATLLQLDASRVNVKATTTEGLGFVGRKEGIAAQAVVSITMLNTGEMI